ncbi:MAG: TonB-dependent receptor, partial [Gammaproteobacteria bacterium]
MRKLSALSAIALALAAAFAPPVWAADESERVRNVTRSEARLMEEVVVTGSYIRRADTFDSSSPLRVIDELYIQEQGATEIGYVILDLPYNMGSNIRQGLQGGNLGGFGNINLRGLGFNATLPLVNGKRVVYENVNHFAPGIAIQRVETLLDGASALYGSDAVAGVINFITRDDFEGLEFRFNRQIDDDVRSTNDQDMQFIVGGDSDRGHFMFAFEWFKRDAWPLYRRDLPNAGDSFFGKTYQLRQINNASNPPSDPQWGTGYISCIINPASCGVDPAFAAAYSGVLGVGWNPDLNCADDPGGIPGRSVVACGFNYSTFYAITTSEDRKLAMVSFDYDLTDTLTLYGSYNIARTDSDNLQSDYPWTSFTPIIPPYNPGLVEDARQRGVPPGTPLTELQFYGRKVMGVPWRQVANAEERIDFGHGKVRQNNDRLVIGLRGDLAYTDTWTWDTSLSYGLWENDYQFSDTIRSNAQRALEGLGGPTCDYLDPTNIANAQAGLQNVNDSGCYFYNPFLNSQYTETGAIQTDPNLVNNWDNIMKWLQAELIAVQELPWWTYDAVATGDLWEINGSPISLAIGGQWRHRESTLLHDNDREDGNYAFTGVESSYERERTVWGIFAEAAVPLGAAPGLRDSVFSNLDLQLAVRYERYPDEELNSTDPKIALVWGPRDDLNVRASFSTSFRAPSIAELNPDEVVTVLSNVSDPANDGATFYVPIRTHGNGDLSPQEANVWNVGFSWRPTSGPMENFTADLDFFSVDYTDLVVGEPFQDIVNADPFDPRVIRGDSGLIVAVEPSYINAGGTLQRGLDFGTSYTYFTDNWGSFKIGLQGVFFTAMDMELYDASCDCLQKVDGIGNRNHDNPFGPLPKIKTNTTFNWSMGPHRLSLIWRHIADYENSGQGTSTITAL